jgi:hypothetical protein
LTGFDFSGGKISGRRSADFHQVIDRAIFNVVVDVAIDSVAYAGSDLTDSH